MKLPTHFLVIFLLPACAFSIEIWSNGSGDVALSLNPTLKLSNLSSYSSDDSDFADGWDILGLYRLRFDFHTKLGSQSNAQIAYEHSGRWRNENSSAYTTTAVLPSTALVPYRITQLYDNFVETGDLVLYHELDRGLIAMHPQWGELTIGRQAIGLGRGRLFSAVDMFLPFSPLEVDREWRRGVDAFRAEYRFAPTSSVEAIAVTGESWNDSALVLRARGYFGNLDAELLTGKRAEDDFVAAVISSAVGDAEVHGELAVFHVPDPHPHGQIWSNDRYIPKTVLGSSYTFAVGNGLTLLGEYHYSGFGAKDISDAQNLFATPEYQTRLLRGDTQTLGRHTVGVQATYPFNESLNGSFTTVMNPDDGSGILSPSTRWDISRTTSFTAILYVPWGADDKDGILQSEYGASPYSLYLQLAFYF